MCLASNICCNTPLAYSYSTGLVLQMFVKHVMMYKEIRGSQTGSKMNNYP